MFLLHLAVVPFVVETEVCACPSGDGYSDDPMPCIVDVLRSELTSAPIHQLRNVFYLSPIVPSTLILRTSVTVNVTCESSKVDPPCEPSVLKFSWGHLWNQDNLAGVMSEVFSARMFQTIDPVTSLLILSEVRSKDSIILRPCSRVGPWQFCVRSQYHSDGIQGPDTTHWGAQISGVVRLRIIKYNLLLAERNGNLGESHPCTDVS